MEDVIEDSMNSTIKNDIGDTNENYIFLLMPGYF